MTKHIGPIFMWIIGAGIVLYVIRHVPELLNGVMFARDTVDPQGVFDTIEGFFK